MKNKNTLTTYLRNKFILIVFWCKIVFLCINQHGYWNFALNLTKAFNSLSIVSSQCSKTTSTWAITVSINCWLNEGSEHEIRQFNSL